MVHVVIVSFNLKLTREYLFASVMTKIKKSNSKEVLKNTGKMEKSTSKVDITMNSENDSPIAHQAEKINKSGEDSDTSSESEPEIKSEEEISDNDETFMKEPQNLQENLNEYNIKFSQILSAVDAVYELNSKIDSKLLFDDEQHIFLQITSIKVPKCPTRTIKMIVPHTLVTDTRDVCIFVKDLKKGRKVDHEPTIEHYQDLFRENGINNIKGIIPVRQLKVEYDQFELKRRLQSQYDHYLVDSKVSGHVFHLLGSVFSKKHIAPTPVRMNVQDLKKNIDNALKKVALPVHSKGDSFTMKVGHTKMERLHVAENISVILKHLALQFPGGFDNVRSLFIKTARSMGIPFYFTLKPRSSVKVPVIKPKRPKAYEDVEDELTTYKNRRVRVHPTGDIDVIDTGKPNKKIKEK